MADQTVKIEGDSGSRERVALDLMKLLLSYGPVSEERPKTKIEALNLYVDCLDAVIGRRPK